MQKVKEFFLAAGKFLVGTIFFALIYAVYEVFQYFLGNGWEAVMAFIIFLFIFTGAMHYWAWRHQKTLEKILKDLQK
jgi:hypothetical protein